MKEIKPLPPSDDEMWGEKVPMDIKDLKICGIHTKRDWKKGEYIDNKDGTISCKCGWGTPLAGYYRLVEGKVIDLRVLNSQ